MTKICLCILMNHPFPGNIPLLRKIYEGRFSTIRFFIPFERLDEDDVLTVYRGSYTHAAYLTDHMHELAMIDCDYFLVLHDDVLLNPYLSEATFRELFPIGPDDGFIAGFHAPGSGLAHWIWFFGFVQKLLYPKSILFGAGVETESLGKYLPSPEALAAKFKAAKVDPQRYVRLSLRSGADVKRQPSRALFHGLAERLTVDALQAKVDAACWTAVLALTSALDETTAMDRSRKALRSRRSKRLKLPFPVVTAANFSDLYIVPRSRFASYAHYVGVTAAANLFVELVVATLLVACCEKVWTAAELDLDAAGLQVPRELSSLENRRCLAMHPVKLSIYSSADEQTRFLAKLDALKRGVAYDGVTAKVGESLPSRYLLDGWHGEEGWGHWSSSRIATLVFRKDDGVQIDDVVLSFTAPVSERFPNLFARMRLNGHELGVIEATLAAPKTAFTISGASLNVGRNLVEIINDRIVRPSDCDPANHDRRTLGFGLTGLCFNATAAHARVGLQALHR